MLRWTPADLPAGWDSEVPTEISQGLGNNWITAAEHPILSVPSSIVPTDFNYIINPKHPDFPKVVFGQPVPFRFDPRLK
jgi:RES domain-containing protein